MGTIYKLKYIFLYTMQVSNIFPANKEIFLNRSTVIYGETESGKTTYLRNILYGIRNDIDIPIICTTTGDSNRAYEDIINSKNIYYLPGLTQREYNEMPLNETEEVMKTSIQKLFTRQSVSAEFNTKLFNTSIRYTYRLLGFFVTKNAKCYNNIYRYIWCSFINSRSYSFNYISVLSMVTYYICNSCSSSIIDCLLG